MMYAKNEKYSELRFKNEYLSKQTSFIVIKDETSRSHDVNQVCLFFFAYPYHILNVISRYEWRLSDDKNIGEIIDVTLQHELVLDFC